MNIRKASANDLKAVCGIYQDIHTAEESGRAVIGWERGVYPTERTASKALQRGDLFVLEAEGRVRACAIINQEQLPSYEAADWRYPARTDQVMVLHTLVVSPDSAGRGYGKEFVSFYETYAAEHGCRALRMDTNEKNVRARAMYRSLGYREAGIVPTVFNCIEGVHLVLLEKQAGPDYRMMGEQLKALAETDAWYVPLFSNASALLYEQLERINWAGFYLVREDHLVLGPFQGKTACIHIGYGKGVCGTAWERNDTVLVEDVHSFPGHIACDSASRSEIVIPVRKNGCVKAVLDIDSPEYSRFSEYDRRGLEEFVRILEERAEF